MNNCTISGNECNRIDSIDCADELARTMLIEHRPHREPFWSGLKTFLKSLISKFSNYKTQTNFHFTRFDRSMNVGDSSDALASLKNQWKPLLLAEETPRFVDYKSGNPKVRLFRWRLKAKDSILCTMSH